VVGQSRLRRLGERAARTHLGAITLIPLSHRERIPFSDRLLNTLKRVFGGSRKDTAQQHLAKLEAGLAGFKTLPLSESVRLFADLCRALARGPLSAPCDDGAASSSAMGPRCDRYMAIEVASAPRC